MKKKYKTEFLKSGLMLPGDRSGVVFNRSDDMSKLSQEFLAEVRLYEVTSQEH